MESICDGVRIREILFEIKLMFLPFSRGYFSDFIALFRGFSIIDITTYQR
jgi:hypothetical protein